MLKTAELKEVRINDPFWNRYIDLVTDELIPYQYKMLNDPEASHCIKNFRVAAGLEEGEFKGCVFQDSDLAKWLETVAYSLYRKPNTELEALADEAIALMEQAQQPDGYLNTYFTINAPGKEFKNLKEGHELYTAGHEIEAAVAYYRATGKDRFLNMMRKTADLICKVFSSEEYALAVPGHEEIELALFKLWEVTGEERYLNMAKAFIDRRGSTPNYLSEEHKKPDFIDVWHDSAQYIPEYGQSHLPVREQSKAEGHAVRAMYLYSAMADIASAVKDEALFSAAERLYNNVVTRRMYITGGIGSSGVLERFTTDFDLPNDHGYAESCASVGLAMFSRRMAQITGDARYIDTVERALMNTVLAGVSMDGRSFFYVNPLEVWPESCMEATDLGHVKPIRQPWFGCACCPPNIARTLASLGEYAFFTSEDELYVNLLAGGEVSGAKISSKLPWEGEFSVELPESIKRLYLRIPTWLEEYELYADGERIEPEIEKGYAVVQNASQVRLHAELKPKLYFADPRVRQDAGRCAVSYGPLIYCLEEADNGENLAALYLDAKKPVEAYYDPELFGGSIAITAYGKRLAHTGEKLYTEKCPELEDTVLRFVPYAFWGNRRRGEMSVWVKTLF